MNPTGFHTAIYFFITFFLFLGAFYSSYLLLVIPILGFIHYKLILRRENTLQEEIQQARNAKEAHQVQCQSIHNQMFDGLWILNSKLQTVSVNQALCNLFGFEESDIMGKLPFQFTNETNKEILKQHLDQLPKDKEVTFEITFLKKDRKNYFHVLIRARKQVDSNQNITGIYLILTETTVQRHLKQRYEELNRTIEQKIHERTEYTRSIIDSLSEIVYVQSRNQIIDANKAFIEFFGDFRALDNSFIKANTVCDQFLPIEEDGFIYDFPHKDYLAMLLVDKKYYKVQIKKGYKTYIFHIRANYLSGRADDPHDYSQDQFIISLADITELEVLRKDEINLAKLTSVGRLAAGITHEINTPLTYIKGNMEMLQMETDDLPEGESRTFFHSTIETIWDGIKRLENIITSMKEIVGKNDEEKRVTNIYSTVIIALRMLYNRSKHITPIYINGQTFDTDLSDDVEIYEANVIRQRIEQVWIIILNNALDELQYNSKPFLERRIDIEIMQTEEDVILRFKDNAGGIADEMMEKIFDPLASTKTSSGMGLGLNIAKKIINEHHGNIAVCNEQEGAIFNIRLKKF